MSSVYDDPDLQDSDFPPTVKFEAIGDRVRGTVLAPPTKFLGRKRQDGTQNFAIKYRLGRAALRQRGQQSQRDEVELLAGSKNLKGQLMSLRPEAGDVLDIELVETKRSEYGSDTKIYKITIEGAIPGSVAPPAYAPPPAPVALALPLRQRSPGHPRAAPIPYGDRVARGGPTRGRSSSDPSGRRGRRRRHIRQLIKEQRCQHKRLNS
jgi:hypothetical protein